MQIENDKGRRRRTGLAAWALSALALAVLWAVDPTQSPAFPGCPFHALTGLHCPGCGATRALHHLLRGHLALALQCHAPLVSLVLGGVPVWLIRRLPRRRPPRAPAAPTWLGWTAATAVLAFTVLRNIPAEPYCRLAPPAPVQQPAPPN